VLGIEAHDDDVNGDEQPSSANAPAGGDDQSQHGQEEPPQGRLGEREERRMLLREDLLPLLRRVMFMIV
jgi:hypothetical protein